MFLTKEILEYTEYLAELALKKSVQWAEINTGSYNLEGLSKFIAILDAELEELNFSTAVYKAKTHEEIDDDGGIVVKKFGDILHGSLRDDLKDRVLLMGHADTVFGSKDNFQKVKKISENVISGPGIADMKGGLAILLSALKVVEKFALAKDVGIDVLINSDEEIGSYGSCDIIRKYAKIAKTAFVVEPVMGGNCFARKRAGSGNFTCIFKGKAAHAGREIEKGRNAITAATDAVSAIDNIQRNRKGLNLNIARIKGGRALNVVPDLAVLRFNIRSRDKEMLDDCIAEIDKTLEIIGKETGVEVELKGSLHRPVKNYDESQKKLENYVTVECGKAGLDANWSDTNGVCDGNIISDAGCPVVDTLGVCGGKIHTPDEYVEADSYYERTLLLVRLLTNLNKG